MITNPDGEFSINATIGDVLAIRFLGYRQQEIKISTAALEIIMVPDYLSLAYQFSDTFSLSVGGNNLFDVYPDKYNNTTNGFSGQTSSYASGQIPYSRNSNQFGFNGRYLFMSVTMTF